MDWIPVSSRLPERGQRIEWISPGGTHQRGTFIGGVIWMPEGSEMYVYYTPTYWRPLA
jgi:hypothetical protein